MSTIKEIKNIISSFAKDRKDRYKEFSSGPLNLTSNSNYDSIVKEAASLYGSITLGELVPLFCISISEKEPFIDPKDGKSKSRIIVPSKRLEGIQDKLIRIFNELKQKDPSTVIKTVSTNPFEDSQEEQKNQEQSFVNFKKYVDEGPEHEDDNLILPNLTQNILNETMGPDNQDNVSIKKRLNMISPDYIDLLFLNISKEFPDSQMARDVEKIIKHELREPSQVPSHIGNVIEESSRRPRAVQSSGQSSGAIGASASGEQFFNKESRKLTGTIRKPSFGAPKSILNKGSIKKVKKVKRGSIRHLKKIAKKGSLRPKKEKKGSKNKKAKKTKKNSLKVQKDEDIKAVKAVRKGSKARKTRKNSKKNKRSFGQGLYGLLPAPAYTGVYPMTSREVPGVPGNPMTQSTKFPNLDNVVRSYTVNGPVSATDYKILKAP